MYQALYRKYRPNNFSEVVGQSIIIRTLENSIKNNCISHAYLFTGPRGTGKTSIAKIFAKTINCMKLENLYPCNECVSCTQINAHQTTDIIEIDAASNNGIDEIRELKSKVNLVPSNSKYKIYIIDEVHMLTIGAFNALLKTLEEPPSHIIFILATTDPHKIPSTILSRCQRFDFKKISIKQLEERLSYICSNEHIDVDNLAIKEIARISDGGMRDAISILDQVISYSGSKINVKDVHDINGTITQDSLTDFMQVLVEKDILKSFKYVDEYDENGVNFIKLTEEIILFLKNCLLSLEAPQYLKENQIDINIYREITNKLPQEELLKAINEVTNSLQQMKANSNPKLIFELMIVKFVNVNNDIKIVKKEIKNDDIIKNTTEKEEIKKIIKPVDEAPKQTNKSGNTIINDKDQMVKEKFEIIKTIRIENALADFDKKKITEFKKKLEDLQSQILDTTFGKYATLVLDGTLKVVGDKNLIFVYRDISSANLFNQNIIKIEKMFKKVFKLEIIVVATDLENWNMIRDDFNKKTKTYVKKDEPYNLEEIFKKNEKKDDVQQLFEDIIQYE